MVRSTVFAGLYYVTHLSLPHCACCAGNYEVKARNESKRLETCAISNFIEAIKLPMCNQKPALVHLSYLPVCVEMGFVHSWPIQFSTARCQNVRYSIRPKLYQYARVRKIGLVATVSAAAPAAAAAMRWLVMMLVLLAVLELVLEHTTTNGTC